jgi:hypothetical protein
MCEFFYQKRRNPQPEMDERGAKIPNLRELYRYINNLSTRLEKTEKELEKLKLIVNSRQKRSIMVWLNKPSQKPSITFEDWYRNMKATESDMIKVLNGDLTDGILSCLYTAINSQSSENIKFPIRCFKQKPGTMYVYSLKSIDDSSEEITMDWKIMSGDQFLKMINHISREIRRKYYIWEKTQIRTNASEDDGEYDQTAMDKTVKYEKKLNGDIDKRLQYIKKDIFSKLEEDLHVAIDIDFE